MRAMIRVATREVMERKLIFAACLMLGILSLAAPLLPDFRLTGGDPKATISFFAFAFTFMFGLSLSFMTGATIISRDLAERRMSFYFSKPISHWSIWGGKMLGAFLITVIGSLLAVLPATMIGGGLFMLTNPKADPMEKEAGWVVDLVVWTIILFFIAIGHFASIALRARSKWVALDIFGASAITLILYYATKPLVTAGAMDVVKVMLITAVLALLLSLFVAGAIGIARGRTDIRVVHAATSIGFMSIMGPIALATLLYSAWVRSPDVADLKETWVDDYAPAGEWIYVVGSARGRGDYTAGFILNPVSGNALRLPPQGSVSFSDDGKRAVWTEIVSLSPILAELHLADLTQAEPVVKPLLISMKPPTGFGPVISPDGSRIALIDGETLSIYDASSSKSLASVPMKRAGRAWAHSSMAFHGNDIVRIHLLLPDEQNRAQRVTLIYEYDLPSKKMTEVAKFIGYRGIPNSTRDRMIANVFSDERMIAGAGDHVLMDRSGNVVRPLSFDGEKSESARWLMEDRIAVVTSKNATSRLHVLDANGTEISAFDLSTDSRRPYLGVQEDAQKLPFALRKGRDFTLYEIDLASGAIREIAKGLRPATQAMNRVPSRGIGSRIYRDRNDGLFYVDLATGQQKLIAGRGDV